MFPRVALDGLSVGQSVDFGIELVGESYRIVSFNVKKPAADGPWNG